MNAIEIRNLSKSFRGMYAVDHLNMTVPVGAIYGFIGENGSGKSTTEKLICGHLVPDGGKIKLFGRDYTDPGVRVRVGALILGIGMSCCMVWTDAAFVVGIIIGVIGMAVLAMAYPIYNRTIKKEREKVAPEILRLTEDLMK